VDQIVLLHISDTHIGEVLTNSKEAAHPGYNSHHIRLCRALDFLFQEDIFTVPDIGDLDKVYVIVSGDITSSGKKDGLSVAHNYFQSSMLIGSDEIDERVGLDLSKDSLATVPGNHDHWYGQWIYPVQRGYARQLFPTHFQTTPWIRTIVSGQLQLDLFGIDSNSHFRSSSINLNPGASGGFSEDEKAAFEALLGELDNYHSLKEGVAYRTKAILCHHPLTTDGVTGPLNKKSANWLKRTAAEFSVPVIFTGHTHSMEVESFIIKTVGGIRIVKELRCPTTLQAPPKLDPINSKPGCWLHQIILTEDNRIKWTSRLFLYHNGFFRFANDKDWFSFIIS
jgi:hypothetical protein